jgi:hypothetical protein
MTPFLTNASGCRVSKSILQSWGRNWGQSDKLCTIQSTFSTGSAGRNSLPTYVCSFQQLACNDSQSNKGIQQLLVMMLRQQAA